MVTDIALDWLQRDRQQKPWMLILGHKATHSFYTPEKKYEHAFDNVPIDYPASAFSLEGKPDWVKDRRYTWHGIYGPLFEWRKTFPDDRPEAVKDFANMVRAYRATLLSSAVPNERHTAIPNREPANREPAILRPQGCLAAGALTDISRT